ncbi:MAG: serine hydrolase [Chloroflexota bacterium]
MTDNTWRPEKLQSTKHYFNELGSSALFVLSNGKAVINWGQTDRNFNCHSIRKSLLNALIGIAVEQGQIDLNATLAQLAIDDKEPLSEQEKQATVISLLKSRSGVYHWANYQPKADRKHLPKRESYGPDQHFVYNNWDFNALGTIYTQCTGLDIFEAFQQQMAVPLQMEDFVLEENRSIGGPDSIHPAYVFRLSARDLAKLGQLYLQRGQWNGKQILSEAWVAESLHPYSKSPDGRSYGYLWWVASGGVLLPNVTVPDGSFAAYGVGGHFMIVIPEYELVVVHRFDSDQENYQKLAPSPFQQGTLLNLIL